MKLHSNGTNASRHPSLTSVRLRSTPQIYGNGIGEWEPVIVSRYRSHKPTVYLYVNTSSWQSWACTQQAIRGGVSVSYCVS
jgi:hypothetical protein